MLAGDIWGKTGKTNFLDLLAWRSFTVHICMAHSITSVSFSNSSVLPPSHATIFPSSLRLYLVFQRLSLKSSSQWVAICKPENCVRCLHLLNVDFRSMEGSPVSDTYIYLKCPPGSGAGWLAFNKEDRGQLTAKCVKVSCLGEQLEGKPLQIKMIRVPLWYKMCVIGTGRQTFIREDVLPATLSHNPPAWLFQQDLSSCFFWMPKWFAFYLIGIGSTQINGVLLFTF